MANRFPLIVNNTQQRLEEIPSGDNLNLSSTGIYDGTSSGSSNNILTSTGSSGVQWKSISSILPTASTSVLGGIKVGTGLSIDGNGVVSVTGGTGSYTLPTASSTVLGGIKLGTGLSIDGNGVVSVTGGTGSYTLPTASASVLGGIKVGTGLSINNGVLSVSSGLAVRTFANITTTSIANDVSQNITISAVKTYVLHKIETSHAAWVTVYTSSQARTNDASRLITTDPVPGDGVIAESITTSSNLTQIMSPGVIGWNEDGTNTVYVKVVNKSGSNVSNGITVTLHYVQLEG